MSRSFGFQQQSYAVHQEVQQQSYGVEAAAWHSKNQYDNQFVLMPSPCIDPQALLKLHNKLISRKHGVHQNGWHHETTNAHYYNNHVSGGKRLPFNAWNASNFSDEMEENAEYETSFHEMLRVPATVRVHERRYYERSSWGDNGYDDNITLNLNGSYGKSEWLPRGL